MLLNALAEVSNTTTASIKFYRREGLLPAGTRLTATRQDYGQGHVERLQLIRVLREEAGATIPDIRALVTVIDDPRRPLVNALEIAQSLAEGLSPSEAGGPPGHREDPMIRDLLTQLGWPDVASGPRRALGELLEGMRAAGSPVDRGVLLRYGRALDELTRVDIAGMHEPAQPPVDSLSGDTGGAGETPSRDVIVARAVWGMVSCDRLTRVLRALGHVSHSVRSAGS